MTLKAKQRALAAYLEHARSYIVGLNFACMEALLSVDKLQKISRFKIKVSIHWSETKQCNE